MGFMEVMVSASAVMMVITMYLAFAAASSMAATDPLDDMDVDSLDISVLDGVTLDEDYMYQCIGGSGLSGMSVSVSIPYFREGSTEFSLGDPEGMEFSRSYILLKEYDNGRVVPVIAEVTAFV